jgi:hypothetical protein
VGNKRRPHADHRADTRAGALSGLPHVVTDSEPYLDLYPFERCVLGEILRRFNGYNNGSIAISYQELGQRLKGPNATPVNNARIARAVARLIDHGFIGEPEPASWLQRRSREYRLTFISSGKAPPFKSATNDYLRWSPNTAKNVGDAASPEAPQSGDARSPEAHGLGDDPSPGGAKNGSFPSPNFGSAGDAGSPLILSHTGATECEAEPAQNIPESEDDPISANGRTDGLEAVYAIQKKLVRHWKRLKTNARRRTWAAAHAITFAELREYVIGDPTLMPFPGQCALASAVRAEEQSLRDKAKANRRPPSANPELASRPAHFPSKNADGDFTADEAA